MKNTNSPLVFGAFVVACLAAVRCGGDDSNTPAGTAGTTVSGAGGSAAGSGGSGGANAAGANNGGANNGGANNGGANNGGANNGGANNGGSANPTDGGGGAARPDGSAGAMMGAGGTTQIGGDSGMCPAKAPMSGDMCTGNEVCQYPTQSPTRDDRCSCGPNGPRRDGGRESIFVCFPVNAPRDAGGNPGADAGGIDRCAGGTNAGDNCNMPGTVCRDGNNGFCACTTVGNNTEWFCN